MTAMLPGALGSPIDPALVATLTRACEDREGRPISGGRELRFRCPVHAPDVHPSARWNPEQAVWRCDACEAGGGAIALADLLGIDTVRSARLNWQASPIPARRPIEPIRPVRPGTSPEPTQPARPERIVAVYPYGDGRRVLRLDPKSFRPEHDVAGQWRRGKGPDPWPLYRQNELPTEMTTVVHVTEGEKDADTLAGLGWYAVSPGSSATPWQDAWTVALVGRPVVVHADNDQPGRKRADAITGRLFGQATSVRIANYDDLPPGADVSDFLLANDAAALTARINRLTPLSASAEPATDRQVPATLAMIPQVDAIPFPSLPPEARHGLAGEFLAAIEPETEADPAALLVTLLVLFGAAIGRGPHVSVSADRHGANLFAVIVGDTAKARKGTSRAYPEQLMTSADIGFRSRIAAGVGSGEGIVWAIRDPIVKVTKGVEAIEDPGVADKRLCVFEEEFSSVVKVMLRDGNTVSETLRRAWDSRALGSLTKNSPARCTNPHVALLGHVTRTELLRVLTETEAANGFANRILWTCARRSRLLPEGGSVHPATLDELAGALRARLEEARRRSEIRRTPLARAWWADVYEQLSAPGQGMMGAMTARSEAHVLRLSLVYALLDGAAAIDIDHLAAAVALWDYCEQSVRYLFGESLGNPVADQIRTALRSGPLSRTQISDLFARNQPAHRIASALGELVAAGLASATMTPNPTGVGRSVETWSLGRTVTS